jgi:hypothetical protein
MFPRHLKFTTPDFDVACKGKENEREMSGPGAEERRLWLARAHGRLDGVAARNLGESTSTLGRCALAIEVGIRLAYGGGTVVHGPVRNGGAL